MGVDSQGCLPLAATNGSVGDNFLKKEKGSEAGCFEEAREGDWIARSKRVVGDGGYIVRVQVIDVERLQSELKSIVSGYAFL